MKIKLTIAYDGTQYAGWQWQKTGLGVQEKVEEAIRAIFQQNVRLHSSSRTDAGVHAMGMVAHFEITGRTSIPVQRIPIALNGSLPPDVRVLRAAISPKTFHARFNAVAKQYRYYVWNHPVANPLLRFQSWHVPQKLNIGAMREAAPVFLGKNDFRAFAVNRHYAPKSTIRTLRRCDLRRSGSLLTFIIEADGFLYRMCRGIVGTLVELGRGKFSAADLRNILQGKPRAAAGMTAPAQGLVLWKVFYHQSLKRTAPAAQPDAHRSGGAGNPA